MSEERREPTKRVLTAKRVYEIFADCLFKKHEIGPGKRPLAPATVVQGITSKFGFHQARLESHRAEVRALLHELPMTFIAGPSEGWALQDPARDKHGREWAPSPESLQELLCLAVGLDLVPAVVLRPKGSG